MKVKIAMIGQKGIPAVQGGVERHVEELSLKLVERGFDVTVYARKWYTQGQPVVSGVEVKHLPTLHTKHLDAIFHSFLATLHAIFHGHDIIHYHGVGPSLVAWIPRIFGRKSKVIVTFHSIDRKHQKWGLLARFMLRMGEWTACHFPHQTIAVSQTIQQYVRDVYDKEAHYIPNAVNLPSSTLSPLSELNKFNLDANKYLLMVSRLIPHKGAHYLIEAWQELSTENPEIIGKNKLVIVGDGSHTTAYVDRLKAQAASNPSIIFTGFQHGNTLSALFSQSLAMVHPSDNEGLPIVVLEAMSHGITVLLSDIPEHKDLMIDKEFFFVHGSVSSLKEKLKMLLQLSAAEHKKQGGKNTQIVTTHFGWEQAVDSIIALYQSEPSKVASMVFTEE